MKITENVYVETGFRGANVSYVTTESGLVMVDTPYLPTDAVGWKKEMEDKGTIKYLVNLEPHHDHCIGNFMFTDAIAIAHEMTRQAMVAMDLNEAIARVSWPNYLPLDKGLDDFESPIRKGSISRLYDTLLN